jgi:aminoglycoside phosphotransferase family enzyme/predicted kinase
MRSASGGASEWIRAALARPGAYRHKPDGVEVKETHISWVFIAGELVYKLKKPLVLEFLDYGTAARRREMCREEVRLNRRLASDIYLGVRGVAPVSGRVELTDEDDPRAVDYVVEMRRYDEHTSLAARLDRGELGRHEVSEVGAVLARFHAAARRATVRGPAVLVLERRFDRNLRELLACVEQRGEVARVQALERLAHAYVAGHARELARRASHGCTREGHGDLRAEHVLVDGSVRAVDCLEFDPDLRELDVADDLAFLVFDLAAHGGERFGELLVQAYRNEGGDPGDDSLIAFYATYRALVRAKVALVRAAQLPAGSAAHGQASADARALILLAERFAWRARLPAVIVVCGGPASGKTHLAAALTQRSGLPHLSADVTRKRLAGIEPRQRAPEGIYTAEWNAQTYDELGRRATRAIAEAGGAIVDATFRHVADRRAFKIALRSDAPTLFIECRAPRAVLADRAVRREHDPRRVSDADVEIVLREEQAWEPLDEVPATAHLTVRTDRPLDEIVADVHAVLDQHLLELVRPA